MVLPKNIVGPPVEGDDCFGRSDEVLRLWNALQTQNIVLSAPRRIGKTSLLKQFAAHARANGAQTIYVDVSGSADELGFIARILQALRSRASAGVPKAVTARIQNALKDLDTVKLSVVEIKRRPDDQPRWRNSASELEAVLKGLADANTPWYFLIDELPVLLKHLAEDDPSGHRVERLLAWCRTLRQTTDSGSAVRWVFCGSIGLVAMTNRLRITHTVNDLTQQPLGPFDADTAQRFLRALFESYKLVCDDVMIDGMLERTRWHVPHHLQALFQELKRIPPMPDRLAWVSAAFNAAVRNRNYYEHWYERLADELIATDARHARTLLEVIAKDVNGVAFSTLSGSLANEIEDARDRQETVLRLSLALSDDGYIEKVDDRWRFRSELLRAFWCWRYVP